VIRVQNDPIAVEELIEAVRGDGSGAVALFLGTVRDENAGRRVTHLEYEAYGELAEKEMRRIADRARETYGVDAVAIVHRTGRLEIGEASVAIAVASAHRTEALVACRFAIDTLKGTVPIWKKEHFEGGSVWIEGPAASR